MKLQINGIVNDSIVDGPGIRMTIFTQGCRHHCPGCHNPQTHAMEGGFAADTRKILKAIAENPLLDGITLSGGDPLEQPLPCADLAKGTKALGLSVWVYTGYTWESLLEQNDTAVMTLLQYTDVLVDGPFLKTQQSLEILFRGSSNQRLIDVPKSLKSNAVVFWA